MPISRESKVKTKLKADLVKLGHFARRFEDQYSVGILDMEVAFLFDDVVWKLEVKIVTGSQKFGMTERQYVEALKYQRLANPAVIPVLAGYREEDKTWFISKPTKATWPFDCVKQDPGESFEHLLNRWRKWK